MRPTNQSSILRDYWDHGISENCPVFNTHAHHGTFGAIYFPDGGSADAMVTAMDRAGVRIAIVSSHEALNDPINGNHVTASVIAAYPDRFRGWLVVNPLYPHQLAKDLEKFDVWQAQGFVGFKIHPGWQQYPLIGPNYKPIFEYAEERGIPILSHTWGQDPFCGSAQVREIVEAYPSIPFLAGHAIHGEWDQAIALAREHPNLYLELTAAYSVNGVLEYLVAGVGAERIVFGDDLPWFDPMHGIGCVLCARISDDDRHAILHKNAERLFGKKL